MTRQARKNTGAAALIAMAMALVGCPEDRAPAEPVEPAADTAATNARPPASAMTIDVAAIQADRAIDTRAVRTVLRDAEPAFLACLDPDGSTGVLAVKLAVEGDGSVGEVSPQPTTTYGTDDARSCLERILAVLRFPTTQTHERFDLSLSLEIRTRHEGIESTP